MINSLMNGGLVELIGWALVHFVWQALLITGTVMLILRVRRWRARERYAICCFALVAIAMLPIATCLNLASVHDAKPAVAYNHHVAAARHPAVESESTGATERAVTNRLAAAIQTAGPIRRFSTERWLPYVVLGWAGGVLLLSLRGVVGALRCRSIRHRSREITDEQLRQLVDRVRRMLNLSWVTIRCSGDVEVPAVFGCIRPIILLPTSILSGLTTSEVESLLVHELAHIRRWDHWINMLQLMVETVLFFHPCVWWLSHRIRVEREYCCDDVAIDVNGNQLAFASALEKIERMRCGYAAAIAASGGCLVDRIRRLVHGEPRAVASPLMPATMLALLIGVCFSWQVVVSAAQENEEAAGSRLKVVGMDFESLRPSSGEALAVEAPKEGRSAVDLVKHFASIPQLGPDKRSFFTRGMITNQESLVSAFPSKVEGTKIEADTVNLSLPEGSRTRAVFRGKSVNLLAIPGVGNESGTAIVVLKEGEVQLMGPDGEVRVTARAKSAPGELVIICQMEHSEVGMRLSTNRASSTQTDGVVLTVKPSQTDDNDADHGWIGFELFPEDHDEGKPLRFKMQWRYDLRRLLTEAEVQAGMKLEEMFGPGSSAGR